MIDGVATGGMILTELNLKRWCNDKVKVPIIEQPQLLTAVFLRPVDFYEFLDFKYLLCNVL